MSEPVLPGGWTASVQRPILHVLSLASYVFAQASGAAARSGQPPARQAAHLDQLEREVAWLREEIRIKDTRMASLPPARRPHFEPCERLAILELQAARNWSLAQTARAFLVTTLTLRLWHRRLDEAGPDALVQSRTPVNRYPDFVRHIEQRLQTLAPTLGKVKLAEFLARAGLHLAASTVGRIRREPPSPTPTLSKERDPSMSEATSNSKPKRINARHPDHIWHIDLTTVPIFGGHWAPWLPFALPACFPFCWWLAVVIDQYSRRVTGITVYGKQPTAEQVKHFLARVIARAGRAPKHLISDRGSQFTDGAFQSWCRRRGIGQRFGAVGQHGSIAVVERFIRTLKEHLHAWSAIAMVRRTSSTTCRRSPPGTTSIGLR